MAERTLKVVILGDVKDAQRALKELTADVDSASGKMAAVGSKMSTVGGKLTKGVTLPLLAAGAGVIALAQRQEDAEAKLTSSFESMGAAAWTSEEALHANAAALQAVSTFGDEAIMDLQALLLTFGNITNGVGEGADVFDRATQAGVDMAAKMGTDVSSAAMQLGKALNDPTKGIAALTRVGITFTAEQEEQIKAMQESGDMMGAQTVILDELERQFGGTAEAMAGTSAGQMKQAMNALGDAGEQLGAILLPIVAQIAGMFKVLAERFQALTPAQQELIVKVAALAAAIGPLLFVAGKLITVMSGFGPVIGMVVKAWKLLNLAFLVSPWGLVIAGVALVAFLIYKYWDEIVAFFSRTWEWIKRTAGAVWEWMKSAFRAGLEFVKNLFLNWTGPGLLIKHFDAIRNKVIDTKEWIVDAFEKVVTFFRGIGGRIRSATAGMWDGIKTAFRSALNWLIGKWNAFEIRLGGQTVSFAGMNISVPSFTLRTPNIPRFHDGGVFTAPGGAREGLALLETGETIIPRGGAGGGVNVTVHVAGSVVSERDLVEAVHRGLLSKQRVGPLGFA